MEKEITKTFEIIVNGKTYISKKMNPVRRGLIMKDVIGKLSPNKKEPSEVTMSDFNNLADLFSKNIPMVMWEFVKDEDKKEIGTKEAFFEELDDENGLAFLGWCIKKINEMNDFLGVGQLKASG